MRLYAVKETVNETVHWIKVEVGLHYNVMEWPKWKGIYTILMNVTYTAENNGNRGLHTNVDSTQPSFQYTTIPIIIFNSSLDNYPC